MPLGPEYDKMIDSKFADMKNTGGASRRRDHCGLNCCSVSWTRRRRAHLDIAGHRHGIAADRHQQELGIGFGVRLLDRLVADYYEK
jgi:leucyl aminopeptidase